jgi:lysine-N-methylase
MKYIYPDYYPDFKCSASACRDNCCIGWEIDIDSDTLSRYQAQPGDFGKRLHDHISLDTTPHFLLKGERCPFLNDRNLCDIFITLGEDALCEICTQHPRFHAWFGNVKESGIGLCCESAAKLILGKEAPTTFINTQIDDETASENFEEEALFRALCAARELLWSLLQDRSYSIWERLAAALRFAGELQDCLDAEFPCEKISQFTRQHRGDTGAFFPEAAEYHAEKDVGEGEKILSQILSFFLMLEPLDKAWPAALEMIQENLTDICRDRTDFMREYLPRIYEYEQLAVYFGYRYMLKSVYSGDVLSKIKLMIVSVVLLSIIDTACWRKARSFSLNDRVRIAKSYSKEIEYCEENLLRFWEASWEETFFSSRNLLALLEELGNQ